MCYKQDVHVCAPHSPVDLRRGPGRRLSCNRTSGKKVIGVVPKGTNHIFWQTVHAGALKAADEFDLEILWNAPQLEIDSSRQIAIVENLITRQVDGIVLAPVDEEALISVVERAVERGIPVSIFDSGIKTDKIISYVATDNYNAGAMAGAADGRDSGRPGQGGRHRLHARQRFDHAARGGLHRDDRRRIFRESRCSACAIRWRIAPRRWRKRRT